MTVNRKQIIKYMVLPGILPRLRELIGSGFVSLALLLAYIFSSVHLLPRNHPYLNSQNVGRFGVRHVIAAAANNIELSKKNTDKIVIFITILTGLVILIIQFVLLLVSLLTQPVFANQFSAVFSNPSSAYGSVGPAQDIAFILLDRIFGVTGIFGSCISEIGTACTDIYGNETNSPGRYPFPIHSALHQMLGLYSLGIGVLSLIIIIYQVINVVGETAATGTPFGQRFNKAWAPVRLILFFALLVPLNVGGANAWFNGAQLITLWTAKWGSNLATNGWARFNKNLSNNLLGEAEKLIATPELPELGYLMQFYTVMHTCKTTYEKAMGEVNDNQFRVKPYFVNNEELAGGDYGKMYSEMMNLDKALKFFKNGNLSITYGVTAQDAGLENDEFPYPGHVKPLCGKITLVPTDLSEPGAKEVLDMYWNLLFFLSDPAQPEGMELTYQAACIAKKHIPMSGDEKICYDELSNEDFAVYLDGLIKKLVKGQYEDAIQEQIKSGEFDVPEGLLEKGWGGAAIWYNTIAKMNGAMVSAVTNAPNITKYPELMHEVEAINEANAENDLGGDRYNPGGSGESRAALKERNEFQIATSMHEAYKIFQDYKLDETSTTQKSGNKFIDVINFFFGSHGLFDMRANTDVHPLAQLSALGRGLVETAFRNFGVWAALKGGGTLMEFVTGFNVNKIGQGNEFSSYAFMIATTGAIIGFILFYVIPFMPFLYFFFALGAWIKSIFEAIAAMPLWALAHLTIDGEGLPGQAATSGYYLLFEILIRPILTVFALLASITIFSAMVYLLNDLFDLLVANVAGNDAKDAGVWDIKYHRAAVDEFFFTLIYGFAVYLMAQSSFKLIDMIPNSILRWMSIDVQTFQESGESVLENMTREIYQASQISLGQLSPGQVSNFFLK